MKRKLIQNEKEASYDSSLRNIEVYHDHDVLSGRGALINNHRGNYSFRYLVDLEKERYLSSTLAEKTKIAIALVSAIRNQNPPGRFLKQDPQSGLWNDIGYDKALEKTRQALREGQPRSGRQSTRVSSEQNVARKSRRNSLDKFFFEQNNLMPRQDKEANLESTLAKTIDQIDANMTSPFIFPSTRGSTEQISKQLSSKVSNGYDNQRVKESVNNIPKDIDFSPAKEKHIQERFENPANNREKSTAATEDPLLHAMIEASVKIGERNGEENDEEVNNLIFQTFGNLPSYNSSPDSQYQMETVNYQHKVEKAIVRNNEKKLSFERRSRK